jgi:enamine deaminase RidA (YjgF/YER057c/UK114 family)
MSERREIQMPATQELFEQLGAVEAVRVGDTVYVSGQVGIDQNAKPASGLEAQARLVFQNLKAVLEKAGAQPRHIVHLQLFVVDPGQAGGSLLQKLEVVFKAKKEAMPECKAAATGVRVAELAFPELMLEVQAIAVVN